MQLFGQPESVSSNASMSVRIPTAADKMRLCLYVKYLGVSAKLTIYIVPICVVVELKRTYVKLSVNNMHMTFARLFSCGFRHVFNHINKKALQSDLDL